SFSESLSITDTATQSGTTRKSFSESPSFADTVTSSNMAIKSNTDSIALGDDLVSAINLGSTQVLVGNLVQNLTVTSDKPQLVISSSNAVLSNVTVPAGVAATINYSKI